MIYIFNEKQILHHVNMSFLCKHLKVDKNHKKYESQPVSQTDSQFLEHLAGLSLDFSGLARVVSPVFSLPGSEGET